MRLNNGTAASSASSKGGGGGRSQSREIRFEISDDLLHVPPDDSSDEEEPSWVPRSQLGRCVNDLRNGRAGTPTSSIHSTGSTVRTRQSTLSEQKSRASTTASRRSAIRRRETFASTEEPHPYGLENRGVITKPTNRNSPSPSRLRVIEQVAYRRETTNSIVFDNGTEHIVHPSNHNYIENRAERVTRSGSKSAHNNANNNKSVSQSSKKYKQDDADFLLSSDSETSIAEDGRATVNSSVSYAFRSIGYYVKKGFSSVCTYIYLFIVGMFVFEKWCLHVKRRAEENHIQDEGVEYIDQGQSLGHHRYQDEHLAQHRYQGESGSHHQYQGDFLEEHRYEGEGGNLENHRYQEENLDLHQQQHYQSSSLMESFNAMTTYFSENTWKICKILLRLLLVILILFLIWNYGSYLLALGFSGAQTLLYGIVSAFTTDVRKSEDFAVVQEVHNPANVREAQQFTEKSSASTTVIIQKDSKDTLAALKSTQETIDALKLQIAAMETILQQHGIRFKTDEDLKGDVAGLRAAIEEINSRFGKMEIIVSQHKNVEPEIDAEKLKTIFLPILAKEIEKINSRFVDMEASVDEYKNAEPVLDVEKITNSILPILEKEIQQSMDSRFEKMETILDQHTRKEPEVDIEKLKTVILPILSKEIHSSVALSCATRNCPGGVVGEVSNEDIEMMIKRAIAKYDADKTGLPDLALESAGGSILSTRCTKSSELRNSVISYWGFRLWSPPNTPRTIIQPGVVPGECWAFEGSVGDVVIKLAIPAVVDGFTLEHIPKSISRYGHIDSAPKHFQVLGLQTEHDTTEVHDYGSFMYEDNGAPLQYFPVVNYTTRYYPIVELKILSNHGNMRHTCIYRFRVHGKIDLTRSQNGGVKTSSPLTTEEEEEESKDSNNSN